MGWPEKNARAKIDCFKNKAARNVRTASLCSFISAWLVFSPLPVPTGMSDFLPEPSALLGSRCIPNLHLLLRLALQMELYAYHLIFKCCCAPATILASLHGGT
jgi:hypothetical protein